MPPENKDPDYINPVVTQTMKAQSTLQNTAKNSLAQSEMLSGSGSQNIHQSGLKWGSNEALTQTRHQDHEYKPYDDFTKEFDQTQIKTRLRIPY